MGNNPLTNFSGQIQALPFLLQHLDYTKTLFGVTEAITLKLGHLILACMTEGCVTDVMAQADSLSEILV